MSAARSDLKAAEKQYALLKASPTPEELAEAVAKVAEADRALAVAKAQREMLKITSPLDATVVRVNVNRGEVVDATKIMAEVTALDRLVVNVTVSARELGALKEGQVAEVRVDDAKAAKHSGTTQPTTEPSESPAINGKVRMIGYQVDRKSDTVPVWIGLPADAGLRPGQYARVRIIVEEQVVSAISAEEVGSRLNSRASSPCPR